MVQVLAPRAGVAGMIATLFRLGVQIIEVVTGAGAFTKYTVGPAWTGAAFQTIPDAVAAADSEGHSGTGNGQTVDIFVYAGRYTDAVLIPSTLPKWNLIGSGIEASGVEIISDFVVEMGAAGAEFYVSGCQFGGGVCQVNQASGTPSQTAIFDACRFSSGLTINARGVNVQFWNCTFSGTLSWLLRQLWCFGGRFFNGVAGDCDLAAGALQYQKCYFQGVSPASPISSVGRSQSLTDCIVYYGGAASVVDATATFTEYTGCTFSRNSGPAGAVVRKTGASDLTDGGNTFVDGAEYPFFEIVAGARPNRGQTDDQLRAVLPVSGSPVLTAAQVGSQRRTTIYKTDNGGIVTLPAIATVEPGCTLLVVDGSGNAGAGPIGINGDGAETINGAPSASITSNNEVLEIQQVTATNWALIGRYP